MIIYILIMYMFVSMYIKVHFISYKCTLTCIELSKALHVCKQHFSEIYVIF